MSRGGLLGAQTMKFDKWNGTDDEGRRVQDERVSTTSSEGNRRDAHQHPARTVRFDTYSEEYDHLVARQQMLEVQLKDLAGEQSLAHKQHLAARRSIAEWVVREGEFLERRRGLVAERLAVQGRIGDIKPKAKSERRKQADEGSLVPLLIQQVALLTEIRDLLKLNFDASRGR
jgi:hypothetical protein